MQFWLRKARITLKGKGGGLVINPGDDTDDQVKIEFAISKSLSSTANTASIQIWNLAESTRNGFGKEFDTVQLEAGYIPNTGGGDNVGIIFAGNLRDVMHRRDGDDIISEIQCGDGDKPHRKAVTNKTYPRGTKFETIVKDLTAEFEKQGASKGEMKRLGELGETKRPYTMCGPCSREMDRIGRAKKFYWSFQDNTIEMFPSDDYLGGMTLLTPTSGLVGVPTITDKGIRAQAMMNPQIRPGRRVQIESETLEMNSEGGVYRVVSCDYVGTNRTDGDFLVAFEAEKMAGGKVEEAL